MAAGGRTTAFGALKTDTRNFANDKQWMLILRVDGLNELIDRLRAHGVEVAAKSEWNTPELGRFARIHDPDGNQVELWEPSAS